MTIDMTINPIFESLAHFFILIYWLLFASNIQQDKYLHLCCDDMSGHSFSFPGSGRGWSWYEFSPYFIREGRCLFLAETVEGMGLPPVFSSLLFSSLLFFLFDETEPLRPNLLSSSLWMTNQTIVNKNFQLGVVRMEFDQPLYSTGMTLLCSSADQTCPPLNCTACDWSGQNVGEIMIPCVLFYWSLICCGIIFC